MAETPLAPFFCPSGFSRHPSAARDRIKTLLHYIMLPSQKQIPSKGEKYVQVIRSSPDPMGRMISCL